MFVPPPPKSTAQTLEDLTEAVRQLHATVTVHGEWMAAVERERADAQTTARTARGWARWLGGVVAVGMFDRALEILPSLVEWMQKLGG